MKLTCEICGSTDLLKQDGVFVCQTCGCKYTIEEVRKMMTGDSSAPAVPAPAPKVDNSAQIANYMDLAKTALDAGNEKEAADYCNKIIEIDPQNWEAWFIKGRAVGWQSTLANIRIAETVNCFGKAMEYCPQDQKTTLSDQCKEQIDKLQAALLSLRVKNFKTNPNKNDLAGLRSDVTTLLSTTVSSLTKIGVMMNTIGNVQYGTIINQGMVAAWSVTLNKYQNNNSGHPYKYAWESFIEEGDILIEGFKLGLIILGTSYDDKAGNAMIIQIYENMITLQNNLRDSCSYKADYSYGITTYNKDWSLTAAAKAARNKEIAEWRDKIALVKSTGARKAAEAAQQRRDAYWKDHADEKKKLDDELASLKTERTQLEKQKKDLEAEKENVPANQKIKDAQSRIRSINLQKDSLGLFKSKEKKALQAQVDAIEGELPAFREQQKSEQAAYDRKILPLGIRMIEINKRIDAINAELKKDR